MKHLLFKSLLATFLVAASAICSDAAPRIPSQQITPWSRMRVKNPTTKWSSPTNSLGGMKRIAPNHSLPQADYFQFLYGPDGSDWYVTYQKETETIELPGGMATEELLKGFTFTIYDNNFKEIGTIHDEIEFLEGETRCAQAMIDVNVTKKFFNYDDKYEVMVTFWMNKADYSMNVRTKVYSIGGKKIDGKDQPVEVIAGYPADAVNLATSAWDEYFYITFLTEEQGDMDDYDDYLEFLSTYKTTLTTYTKATLSSEGKSTVLFQHVIPNLNFPGDQMNCPMMFMKNADGKLTLVYQQYEKPFYIDPTGFGEDTGVTPDNNLVIDVYQLPDFYAKAPEHLTTTKIPTPPVEKEGTFYTYYGIGNLLYEGDIDFNNYSADGSPCFIVSVDEYLIADDDNYNSSYYVYDVNGNRIKTLAEDTYNYTLMADIPGCEPQAAFIHSGDNWNFQFVDLYSANTVATIDQNFNGYGLSAYIDRVPVKNGYQYAVATTNGIIGDSSDVYAPVVWIDKNGEMIRLDKIPVGEGVEMVQFYIASEALSPYLFNTDSDVEYMLLVKRRTPDGLSLQEELLIATTDKGAIYTFTPDEEKGVLNYISLLTGKNPQLLLSYVKDYKYSTDSFDLPFTKFAGGSGSESDPYLIATAGDLMQIASNPAAHYSIVADIDCAGTTLPTVNEFSGSIDGNGHTVSNISMYLSGNAALFKECTDATVKNINFFDCSLNLTGSGDAGFIASTSMGSTFENLHFYRLSIGGDSFSGSFAPIAARAWTGTKVIGCEINDGSIILPNCSGVGGLLGDLRTGSSVTASLFSGSILAENTVGGIAASTTTGDEVISNCHVDADIKAQHTIGGIVGYLKRSPVVNCYVEGTLEATAHSKWTKALALGGIAGELEGDWEKSGSVPVSKNLIGVSAIIVPDTLLTEDYPHQLATVHRVVGRTSYNAELYDTDEVEGPIFEEGVADNLVISDLAVVDSDFDESSIEGTSIDKNEVTTDLLASKLGFAFGDTTEEPWDINALQAYDPSLYFERVAIIASDIEAFEEELFNVNIEILSRTPVDVEDLIGSYSAMYDESLMEMTGEFGYDGKTLQIEFKALKEGATHFSAYILNSTVACDVTIKKNADSGVAPVIESASDLTIANGFIYAPNCTVNVYDINGNLVASGFDKVSTGSLGKGIYIAVASAPGAAPKSLKFVL